MKKFVPNLGTFFFVTKMTKNRDFESFWGFWSFFPSVPSCFYQQHLLCCFNLVLLHTTSTKKSRDRYLLLSNLLIIFVGRKTRKLQGFLGRSKRVSKNKNVGHKRDRSPGSVRFSRAEIIYSG